MLGLIFAEKELGGLVESMIVTVVREKVEILLDLMLAREVGEANISVFARVIDPVLETVPIKDSTDEMMDPSLVLTKCILGPVFELLKRVWLDILNDSVVVVINETVLNVMLELVGEGYPFSMPGSAIRVLLDILLDPLDGGLIVTDIREAGVVEVVSESNGKSKFKLAIDTAGSVVDNSVFETVFVVVVVASASNGKSNSELAIDTAGSVVEAVIISVTDSMVVAVVEAASSGK
jgi:hypothetical protein